MMLHTSEICLVAVILSVMAAVGPVMVDGGDTYWNEADPRLGAGLIPGIGRVTAAEDALRVLRSVPLTELSAGQRRHVKRRILAVLGLDHVPRPIAERTRRGRRDSIAAYMMTLYLGVSDHDEDGSSTRNSLPRDWTDGGLLTSDWHQFSSAEIVISFANQAGYDNRPSSYTNRALQRYFFDMRSEQLPPEAETVTGAVLRVYKFPAYVNMARTGAGDGHHRQLVLRVFMSGDDVTPDRGRFGEHLNSTVMVDSEYRGWIDVNVTNIVSEWTRSWSAEHHGLFLKVSSAAQPEVALDPTEVGLVGERGPDDKQPFVVAFFRKSSPTTTTAAAGQSTVRRQRRSADPGRTSTNNGHQQSSSRRHRYRAADRPATAWSYHADGHVYSRKCQRRQLYVSFRDLDWQDWIIAPEGYAAFYCDGECSFPLHAQMNATNHAIVQTLAHLMKPLSVPQPCCAPTKLSAISVLYFDDNSNVILKKYRNMVVRACGCH